MKRLFDKDDVDMLRQLYIDKGLSSYEIGELLGVSDRTVRNYLKRFGIPIRTISEACKGKKKSKEHKRNLSIAAKGKKKSKETRKKMSKRMIKQWQDEVRRQKQSKIAKELWQDEKYRKRNKANWKDGASFLPYCPKFNYEKKEEIRNQYNRVCVISGISALQNGQRLSVDHVNENKMQGCNGIPWRLIPLARSVHQRMNNQQNHLLLELLLYGNKRAELNYEF